MSFTKAVTILFLVSTPVFFGLVSCGKKCDASDTEKLLYTEEGCSAPQASVATTGNYYIYISSGFPTATGIGTITRWTQAGDFVDIVHDFTTSPGFLPQAVAFQVIDGVQKMLMLSYNGTNGIVDVANTNGTNFSNHFNNNTALIAGTRRMVPTTDGGLLITRTAGVERFNSAKLRVGGAAKYATSGACTVGLGTSAVQVTLSGVEYVVVSNAQTSPANKINLFNGATGACIAGAVPAGPATTMWPVDMDYDATTNKLFVLYYPFTGATSNAQIWSFDVTPAAINNGTLVYNDTYADIASLSATPAALSASIEYHRTSLEAFVLVGTSNNSVLKFSYDGATLAKVGTTPLIYQSSMTRSISNVKVLDY